MQQQSSRGRILLIDDDQEVLRGTAMWLKASGYETDPQTDPRCAVEVAESTKPSAILLDFRMPNQNGLETLQKLQSNESTKGIPVVMLSASLLHKRAALEAGAACFVPKPYSGRQLVSTIEAVT